MQVLYAKELREAGSRVKVNAVCPGYCKTAFNGHRGLRDPADGAQVAIKMALLTDPGECRWGLSLAALKQQCRPD